MNGINAGKIPQTPDLIVGIILAGGAGSRVQGEDKGLKSYKGKLLIKHVIDRLSQQTSHLIISANRNLETYQGLGYPVIKDSVEVIVNDSVEDRAASKSDEFHGPMAGAAACLNELLTNSTQAGHDADYALLSSCDTPNLPIDLVSRLHSQLQQSEAIVAVAHDGQRRQNLHCLIKRQGWQMLIDAYQQGTRAMHRWQRDTGDIGVNFSEQKEAFINLNVNEDF